MSTPTRPLEAPTAETALTEEALAEAALAANSANLRWEDIPSDVVDAALDCIIDTIAVAMGAGEDPAVGLVATLTNDHGPCTRLVDGASIGIRSAALANGVAAHVLDFDDWLPSAGLHPSAPLLPAVLAVAESIAADPGNLAGNLTGTPARNVAGIRLLTAYVAGFEVQARIGAAIAPGHYRGGYHPTATVGIFGAAAAAAHLLDLGPDGTARALGLAAAQAAGLRTSFGTTAKSLQVARAAEAGVLAAYLAAAGATAPTTAVFGAGGFAETHSDTVDPTIAGAGFAVRWYLREALLKRHAACFGTHAPIEALLELRGGLDLRQVHKIEVTVSEMMRTVCAIPSPRTALEGKFSLAFTSALALIRGSCQVADFTLDSVQDRDLVAMAERVQVRFDSSLPSQQAEVRVLLEDGTTRTGTADSSRLPTVEDRRTIAREKLTALGSLALSEEGADALMRALESLRFDGPVSGIAAAIRRG